MKLYTEEQIREVCMSIDTNFYISDLYIDTQIKLLTPIELPSEREIAEKIASTIDDSEYGKLVYAGALWMLDQIKQQDK